MDPEVPNSDATDPLAAIAWLEALADDPLGLDTLSHELRKRLQRAAGRIAPFDRLERRILARQRNLANRKRKRKHDDGLLDGTSNRALKRSLRFPVAPPSLEIDAESRRLLEVQAAQPFDDTPRLAEPSCSERSSSSTALSKGRERLKEPKSCYICKQPYDLIHEHYDSMCLVCASFNWRKRTQTADLSGRVALVTGARVKIGYEAVLMLLRAGSRVVATTRFPKDAARRYAQEHDFSEWQDRLEIYGLDLRHTASIEAFAQHLCQTLPRLDFLIHNACQTVRRPPEYYTHLVEGEQVAQLPAGASALIERHEEVIRQAQEATESQSVVLQGRSAPKGASIGMTHSAELTQFDLLGDAGQADLFPDKMLDGEGQQLDLRKTNSWRMNLADVPTVELLEVQLVNSIAPYVLTARLKPLMLRIPTEDKHIVNVSAMEGQFNRNLKTTRHPHTNMAKAALNMMTRTSAAEFVTSGIHMNSVDTGWVTDEDPFAKTVNKQAEQRFVPPLDSIDGASRVLDPIFTGFLTGTHCWGQFLKDFAPTDW